MRNALVISLTVLAVALAGTAREYFAPQAPAPAQSGPQEVQPASPGARTPPPLETPPGPVPLRVVVLDPAHGGADLGARGTGGLRESDLVLDYAGQIRAALERDGWHILLTRQGNEDPSFDERSAMANGQRGAVFISLHVGSTGLPGTVRVYTIPDPSFGLAGGAPGAPAGLIPWEQAQAPFLNLSRKLADLAQGELALQFRGSPNAAQTAAVRQLRTVAAPAIAIEISSVTKEEESDLERMGPGLAACVERALTAFRPFYDASPIAPPGGTR